MLTKVHKNTIKSKINHGMVWSGYITPSNVNSFHITGGWSLGYFVNIVNLTQLEDRINSFKLYNCCAELGNSVRFWNVGFKTREQYLEELKSLVDSGTQLEGNEYDNFCMLLMLSGENDRHYKIYPSWHVEQYLGNEYLDVISTVRQ